MKKICICGAFFDGIETTDGQSVKTSNWYGILVRKYGKENVAKIDTRQSKITLLVNVIWGLLSSDSFIMMPAHNGVRVLTPFLCNLNKLLKRNLYYSVIGGWLPSLLRDNMFLLKHLMTYKTIFVETAMMRQDLHTIGIDNVDIIPNFKDIPRLSETDLKEWNETPLRLVTFSRILKAKGIEDAVNVVTRINTEGAETIYTLDIYGYVDPDETEWFDTLSKAFPPYIRYRGVAKPDDAVNILKDYYALLFPTRFYTEGIPGTIIDAYAAGIPVLASRWQSFDEVVEEGATGFGYEFGNVESLYELLKRCENVLSINELKRNCLSRSLFYTPEYAMTKIHF